MTFELKQKVPPGAEFVLVQQAIEFLVELQRRFNPRRLELLAERKHVQKKWDEGALPEFLVETKSIRESAWKVGTVPADLQDRRVEITGPVERKMMINALNSGAKVFMADFEDANSPTWWNAITGQQNCFDAIRRQVDFKSSEGKTYSLNEKIATLVVRPRGWHLVEKNILIDDEPASGSLIDFGLYFFHNARELTSRGSGPYFYLPKLENHLEAKLWNDVFKYAQDKLNIPQGTIKCTVLIETILAAYEMEEILYELKDHIVALNAGRWDYIFSVIKKFRNRDDFHFPDRTQITMTVPFMRAYAELLVRTCHKRGAHAIGGMSAYIPSRKDPVVNEEALKKVREDKKREAADGFDGTWVAHPDLVPVAKEMFDAVLKELPHQKSKLREDVRVCAADLLNLKIDGGKITEHGIRHNISVALQYLDAWCAGFGAVAIFNLMEDAATAEISRSELWHWRKHAEKLEDGRTFTSALYQKIRDEEVATLGGSKVRNLGKAVEILDSLVMTDQFEEFLTLAAYRYLD